MTYHKKSWQEKLEDKKGLPKVVKLQKTFPCYHAVHKMGTDEGDRVVMVNPSEVVELMRQVPEGRLTTIVEICKAIAKKHHTKACCSLTAGIFIMTAANAAEEAAQAGSSMALPYWRTLKADGFLNEKYPGGVRAQKRLLEGEGFNVQSRGKRYQVQDYQDVLEDFSG